MSSFGSSGAQPSSALDRQPPVNLEAERSVLGGILIKPSAFEEAGSVLGAEDFFLPAHRDIWESMVVVAGKGDPIDVVSLADTLRAQGSLPRLEGAETYLVRLAQEVPTAENIRFYAGIVAEKALLRRIISQSADIAAAAYGGAVPAGELLADSIDRQTRLARGDRLAYFLSDRFRSVQQLGFLEKKAAPRQYLLTHNARGFLPAGRVGMIAAEGGAGKSWGVIQLAVAVATGTPWFNTFSVNPEKRGKVLLVLAEEELEEVHFRMEQACDGQPAQARADVSELIFPLPLAGEDVELIRARDEVEMGGGPLETRFFRELMRTVEDNGPWSLIVFDPLSRFAAADTETDNAAAARMIRTFERFSHAAGKPTVLFAHHTTKTSRREGAQSATAARGASALTDNARWQANLEKRAQHDGAPRLVDLRVVKSNYGFLSDTVTLYSDPERSGLLRVANNQQIAAWTEASRKKGKGDSADLITRSDGPEPRGSRPAPNDDDDHHGWLG